MRARVSEAFSAPRANMASEALRSSKSRRSRASIACPCSVRIRYALRTRLHGANRGAPSFSSLQAFKKRSFRPQSRNLSNHPFPVESDPRAARVAERG